MTRKDEINRAVQMIPFMVAFSEGKTIQFSPSGKTWEDANSIDDNTPFGKFTTE
jgi:hypothetical protein